MTEIWASLGVHMRKLLTAALLAGTFISPVWAADSDFATQPNPARFGWTGFQLGVQYGYGWATDTFPDQGDGDLIGAYAAYNHQFGNVVVGAEFDYQQLDNMYEVVPATLEEVMVLGGRVGYAIDRFLPYVTIGASYANTDLFGNDWGIAFGAGVDVMVTDNILVGAKYLHHDYKNFNSTGIDADLDAVSARIGYKF